MYNGSCRSRRELTSCLLCCRSLEDFFWLTWTQNWLQRPRSRGKFWVFITVSNSSRYTLTQRAATYLQQITLTKTTDWEICSYGFTCYQPELKTRQWKRMEWYVKDHKTSGSLLSITSFLMLKPPLEQTKHQHHVYLQPAQSLLMLPPTRTSQTSICRWSQGSLFVRRTTGSSSNGPNPSWGLKSLDAAPLSPPVSSHKQLVFAELLDNRTLML